MPQSNAAGAVTERKLGSSLALCTGPLPRSRRWLLRGASVAAWGWLLVLFGLTVVGIAAGDATSWLFAVNSLRVYLYLPLPIVTAVAAIRRSKPLALAALVVAAFWLHDWAVLFVPRSTAAPPGAPTFRVMAYNVLGFNEQADAVVRTILLSGADVVALQELNPRVAAAIQGALSREYPHQALDPRDGVTGAGLISRLPFDPASKQLDGTWVSPPHVVWLHVADRRVLLVRFHAFAGTRAVQAREEQARIPARFSREHPGPLVALGDLNATDGNTAYAIVARELADCWRDAGWGFGHTFPGALTPGGSRPVLLGVPVPQWLVRIDYVFRSHDLATVSAYVGPHDGASDHRPVVADLALVHRGR